MEVLNDFEASVADAKRETEGILIKGSIKELTFEDGQMMTFGSDIACDIYIPHEELSPE